MLVYLLKIKNNIIHLFKKYKENRKINREKYIKRRMNPIAYFIYTSLKDENCVWMMNHWEIWIEKRNPEDHKWWVYDGCHADSTSPCVLWMCNGHYFFRENSTNYKFSRFEKRILWSLAIQKCEQIKEEDKLNILDARLRGKSEINAQRDKTNPLRRENKEWHQN